MVKSYNLSVLFQEDEFDVQKNYNHYETKEAYFSVLQRFTHESGEILLKCRPEQYNSGRIDIDLLAHYAERLQGLLTNIGAVKLAWDIQNLNHMLEKKYYKLYVNHLAKILPDVDRLRRRIESAEKTGDESEHAWNAENKTDDKSFDMEKRKIKPERGSFKKLLMLIDNFEFESAAESVNLMMRYSYTPEIDASLEEVSKALDEFNFAKSLEKAQKLYGLVIYEDETEKPVKKSILAIDDMPDVLRTLKTMLKSRYNVFGVTNYEMAIRFLRSNTADLILLDIEMPGLDGFAMMQLFRKLPEYANTPIIFLTSNVSDQHIRMAKSLGANDFIKKPVNLLVLINKLESAISQK